MKRVWGLGTSALAVLALAACTSSAATATTSSGTMTPTSATASATATSATSSASAAVTPTATITATIGPSSPTAAAPPPPSPASGPTRCTSSHLDLSLTAGAGAGAGSRFPYIVFTNTGSSSCTLYGRPGVSFVGNGNGTQLGAAADFDTSVPAATVTLAPGGSAHAPLKITVAQNYDATECQPSASDGLRVYAPGETHAQFIATTDYTACLNASVHLLTVQAVQPGA